MINFHLYVVEPTLAHQTVYTVPVCLLQNTKKTMHIYYTTNMATPTGGLRGAVRIFKYYAHISVNSYVTIIFF